ncbi:hypothetical protein [Moraxella lacunata]|uniref:hypothetical protein n=1 Tax=Moraxella lacunata TaxID=477 RepID=UPI003EDFECD7
MVNHYQISSTPKKLVGINPYHTVIACTDETKQQILQKQCLSCVFVCVWQKILRTLMCKIKNRF